MRGTLLVLLPVLAACSSAPAAPPPGPRLLSELETDDFVARLAERLANPARQSTPELMKSLEQNMAGWQAEQSQGSEAPLENILTITVVTHYEQVAQVFRGTDRDRRLVATWALGFSRVPENSRGIRSPHPDAVILLVGVLDERDDELSRNALTALWKIGDPQTPLQPLFDLVLNHHDPDVRANAALALGTVLTPRTAPGAVDTVLVALRDAEPKVRLHAASVARRHPSPSLTQRIVQLLPGESVPLVRANMAAALGAARERSAAPLLVSMLGKPGSLESQSARQALTTIFGVDRGDQPAAWSDLLR
jgi:hypothetical protein